MKYSVPVHSLIQRLKQRDLLEMAQRVAKKYRVTATDIVGRSRTGAIVTARHALWLELYDTTAMSYPDIGALFDRDHTTIMAGVKKLRKTEPEPMQFNVRVAV